MLHRETILLVQMSNALALGLVQPWLPSNRIKSPSESNVMDKKEKDGNPPAVGNPRKATKIKSVDSKSMVAEAMPSLQAALEVQGK